MEGGQIHFYINYFFPPRREPVDLEGTGSRVERTAKWGVREPVDLERCRGGGEMRW